MVPLLQPLQFESKQGVAHLVLWLCEPFDMHYSFRAALVHIEHALGEPTSVTYALPPEEPGEDFVDGQFVWANRGFGLYYERSLGYMQFSSSSMSDVEALYIALTPNPSIEPSNGGPLNLRSKN